MEFDEKDNQVINILTKLKDAEGGYPVEMMAARRQTYIKQLTAMGIGTGAAAALKSAAKAGGGGSSIPPVASTLLETVLIVAIVAEAAAVAFINREKVNELVRTLSRSNQPTVEEVVNVPDATDLPVVLPEMTLTFELTGTPTPSGTPTPGLLLAGESTEDQDSAQANSTPDPNENNGNQYGLTPKPERTKEPGNNNKPKKDNTK